MGYLIAEIANAFVWLGYIMIHTYTYLPLPNRNNYSTCSYFNILTIVIPFL